MTNDDPHNLILRYRAVKQKGKAHENPRKIRCRKDEETKEAQPRVGIAPTPDVDEAGRERGAEEGHRDERRQEDEGDGGVEEQPGEVGGRLAASGRRGLLEQARVSLEEEHVKEEIERQRAEVQERGQESPVLALDEDGPEAVEELEGRDDVTLHEDAGGHRRRRPPPRAYRQVVEPCLEREMVSSSGCTAAASAVPREEVGHLMTLWSSSLSSPSSSSSSATVSAI